MNLANLKILFFLFFFQVHNKYTMQIHIRTVPNENAIIIVITVDCGSALEGEGIGIGF
jgi:hypothetical protein